MGHLWAVKPRPLPPCTYRPRVSSYTHERELPRPTDVFLWKLMTAFQCAVEFDTATMGDQLSLKRFHPDDVDGHQQWSRRKRYEIDEASQKLRVE
jgi:hypothetical protein